MRFHQVQIQILDNGAVLMVVGCKTLGFPSYIEALTELTRYYQNPKGVAAEYSEKYGWPVGDNPIPQYEVPEGAPIRSAVMGGGVR